MPVGHPDFAQAIDEVLRPARPRAAKIFTGAASVGAGATQRLILYTVPSGKELYVLHVAVEDKDEIGASWNVQKVGVGIIHYAHTNDNQPSAWASFPFPIRFEAGEYLAGDVRNVGASPGLMRMCIICHEVAVGE